jgi:trigger factor
MAQFGNTDPSEEELNGISARILANEEEVKRLSDQLNTTKMLQFFKENAKLKTKEVSYDKFIKEAYA